eukprot:gene8479-11440_t
MRRSTFVSETWAIGSEMSGGVFNVTVEDCKFGFHASDFAGIHIRRALPLRGRARRVPKTKRGRGASVHSVVFRNVVVDSTAIAMHYSSPVAPTNATATPSVYNVSFHNVTAYLPPKGPTATMAFVGLPGGTGKQLRARPKKSCPLRGLSFRDVVVASGSAAWSCSDTAD